MAEESKFVDIALEAAQKALEPPLFIKRGAALLYQVTVDNRLALTVDPRKPMRGESAFQTDLCVFEEKAPDVLIPRVVLEFKTSITTHDLISEKPQQAAANAPMRPARRRERRADD